MITRELLSRLLILSLVLFNIGCDQVTKSIVRENVGYNENIKIISDHFTLTKVENSGAFLSSGDWLPGPVKFVLLSLLPLLVLGYGIYFVMTKTEMSKLFLTGICFVIGGGIGNLYDRILYGSVTDFLHIDFVIFQTGIFNIADVSIMIGMFMILIHLYFKKSEPELA
ncbi:signal peptidase II [Pedobacter sp. B4-66]|uniref:signal peptidase II n=1 Tax=Pedobacter sp. B4-66 TaxID=2817280 RepID=UPI001BD9C19E|nr:signal peptidase II [Pedobacter sp. B4-66]